MTKPCRVEPLRLTPRENNNFFNFIFIARTRLSAVVVVNYFTTHVYYYVRVCIGKRHIITRVYMHDVTTPQEAYISIHDTRRVHITRIIYIKHRIQGVPFDTVHSFF